MWQFLPLIDFYLPSLEKDILTRNGRILVKITES
jgi:hypothetical protein